MVTNAAIATLPGTAVDGGAPAEAMEARAQEAALLLKVMAHPVRLMLACTLAEGELSVGELERQLGIHQPTLSQQLGVLRQNGIVETRREGKQIFYSLTAAKAARLVRALYDIYCGEEEAP